MSCVKHKKRKGKILPSRHDRYPLDLIRLQRLRILHLPPTIRRLELIPSLDQNTTLARRLKVHLPTHTGLIPAVLPLPGERVLDVERELVIRAARPEHELQPRRGRQIQPQIALRALRREARAAQCLSVQVPVVDGLRGAGDRQV